MYTGSAEMDESPILSDPILNLSVNAERKNLFIRNSNMESRSFIFFNVNSKYKFVTG